MSRNARPIVAALSAMAVLTLTLFLGASSAEAKSAIFDFSSTPTTTQAGGHPDIVTEMTVGTHENQLPTVACSCNDPKEVVIHAPRGVIANPHVASICTAAELVTFECSSDSQVGVMTLKLFSSYLILPIYRTVTPPDQGSMFFFAVPLGIAIPQYMTFNARTDGDFGLDVASIGISQLLPIDYFAPTLWGVPGDKSHDILRFAPPEMDIGCSSNPASAASLGKLPGGCNTEIKTKEGQGQTEKVSHSTSIPVRPMIQNPTTCIGPLTSTLDTTAYDREKDSATDEWPATTGCDQLSFDPSLSANPTTTVTDTASGLDVSLVVPQPQDPSTPSPSELRLSTVTLPKGFSINPNAADGKTVCSDEQARLGTREPAQCPEFSKIGTVVLDSSALPDPIPGAIYLAESKPGDRYRVMLTAFGFGTAIKIPGSTRPDPQTGQLTIAFEDLPEAPFQRFDMHFFGSERGLLATPDKCGTFPVQSTFAPWDNVLPEQSSTQFFVLDSAPNGMSCPGTTRPFAPTVEAGGEDNTAGRFTPVTLRLTREDGEQNLAAADVALPSGLIASLKEVAYCPQSAIDLLSRPGYSGIAEASNPACPASSLVGSVMTGAGAGTKPLYTLGKLYLAGPYKGAPLSLLIVVPAVSGPYDLGNVAVRVALYVDPVTTKVTAVSDPLPQILEGIPLRLRSALLKVDRPNFALNPTNCEASSFGTSLFGTESAILTRNTFFQVANCTDLPFRPKLTLKLNGGVQRRGHPAIHAMFTAPPGNANTASVSVTLPKGELLASEHIGTVCTRVNFAADNCPGGSIIGKAQATSPLLDSPLTGLVYLRSSDNELPDMVLDLKGQVDIEVSGEVDSVDGRLRTKFRNVPDVPVSKLVLDLAGGRKGLLINSERLCGTKKKATVKTTAQNGAVQKLMSRLRTTCDAKAKRKRHIGHRTVG